MSRLSKNIRRRRQEVRLTPRRAAEGAQMDVERWKLIESGEISPHTDELEAISNVLRIAPHILAGWRPENFGIITRMENGEGGPAVVIEWEKPYSFIQTEVDATEGYARVEFRREEG